MEKLTVDYSRATQFFGEHELQHMAAQVALAEEQLQAKSGPGADFLGWLDLPEQYDQEEFGRIQAAAERIRSHSEVLVVVGIGGSYLGARAAISFLNSSFYNELPSDQRPGPAIYYAGINLSGAYLEELIQVIGDRDFSINVISKSGTTTEPALAFRVLRKKLEAKYGKEEAQKRIFATTDREKGALKQLATQEGYETFVVPDDVGGRFSVLTAVGLLPIAVAGIDLVELMVGAQAAQEDASLPFEVNPIQQYAALRNIMLRKQYSVELMINYEPRFFYLAEWWKQLYGESEGKDGRGIFPASANFTTDLHSLGQYVQDGQRFLFETLLELGNGGSEIAVEEDADNLDGLNYLAGKTFEYVNGQAAEGTIRAHVEGGVPNLVIRIPEANAFHLGYMFYFFEKACALSGYVLAVNPFDQPGVEAYKRKMFELLGKPGY